jgi:phosphoglycolate phosphatase
VNVVFDLDGTLVDSLAGVECSMRHAAGARQLPPMRHLMGPPLVKMLPQIWPDLAGDELEQIATRFREHYNVEGCLQSLLYPGVAETLQQLNRAGVSMFVLTNKRLAPSRTIIEKLGIAQFFRALIAPDVREPAFTAKPDAAEFLQREYNLEPQSTWMIGDGADDLLAARRCGFAFAAAGWGYGNVAADTVVNSFSDIPRIVL